MFSALRKSARGRDYEDAIQWLIEAGLVYKNYLIKTPKFPLSTYAHTNAFKRFLFDVGLLSAQSSLSPGILIEGNVLFTEFKGSLTENFIAQELIASHKKISIIGRVLVLPKLIFLLKKIRTFCR